LLFKKILGFIVKNYPEPDNFCGFSGDAYNPLTEIAMQSLTKSFFL
jgi:hypothetical protein